MKRVPALYLSQKRLTVAEIADGEQVWAFRDAIRVDDEGAVWLDRQWNVHKQRLPGMVGIRREGNQYHVRLPRRRYAVSKPPHLDSDSWVPATSVKMFWSLAALLGF